MFKSVTSLFAAAARDRRSRRHRRYRDDLLRPELPRRLPGQRDERRAGEPRDRDAVERDGRRGRHDQGRRRRADRRADVRPEPAPTASRSRASAPRPGSRPRSTVNSYTVNLASGGNARAITMRDLTVVIPASIVGNGGAASRSATTRSRTSISRAATRRRAALVSWLGGGTFTGGRIYSAGQAARSTMRSAPMRNASGTVNIEDAEIEHDHGHRRSAPAGPGTLNVRRSHIIIRQRRAASAPSTARRTSRTR